jgi:hypothetical protein
MLFEKADAAYGMRMQQLLVSFDQFASDAVVAVQLTAHDPTSVST